MKHLFLLLTLCLPLIASKEPPFYEGKTAKVYLGNYAKAKTKEERQKALQSLFNFKPSTLRDDDYEAIVSVVTNLQQDDPALLGKLRISEDWQRVLIKSQEESAAMERAFAESKALEEKRRASAKPAPSAAAAHKPASAANASAAPAQPAKEREVEVKEGDQQNLILVGSKENTAVPIYRPMAIRLSNLVKTTLERNKGAGGVVIPDVSTNTLKAIKAVMHEINKKISDPLFDEKLRKDAANKKLEPTPTALKRMTLRRIAPDPHVVTIELILAAHVMDMPLVLDALIYAYTKKLTDAASNLDALIYAYNKKLTAAASNLDNLDHPVPTGKLLEIHPELKKLPTGLLQLLARRYFLRWHKDIDTYLGLTGDKKTQVTVDALVAYGILPQQYLVLFPDLVRLAGLAHNINPALSRAIAEDDLKVVTGLLKLPGIHPIIPGGDISAAVLGLLLAAGAKPDVPDENGVTPLMWAVRNGNLAAVKLLLKQKLDLSTASKGRNPQAALMIAAERGMGNIVLELLKAGASALEIGRVTYGQKHLATSREAAQEYAHATQRVINYLQTTGYGDIAKKVAGEAGIGEAPEASPE